MDNVRLMVEEDNERIRTYFGKCLAFFKMQTRMYS
jgi:hypothetical protein